MLEKNLAAAHREVVSYDFEIDERLSAFIIRKEQSRDSAQLKKFSAKTNKQKSIIWINNPQYRFDLVPVQVYNKLFLRNIPIFISSCSQELAPFFKKNKFEVIKTGQEAVLHLDKNHFEKKSLKELIRAGLKRGRIEEIFYSDENYKRLELFKLECIHGKWPQLKHFFNDRFLPVSRLFVYGSKLFSKEFFINFTGRKLRYAYNYLGLYNFKNKFNPEWKDIYICCKPKLNLITILKVSWLSNLAKLILKKSIGNIKKIFFTSGF